MTFSQEVKEEISLLNIPLSYQRAMLSSIVKINGSLLIKNNDLVLSIRSEVSKIARMIFTSLQSLYNIEPRIMVAKRTTLKKNNYYIVEVSKKTRDILKDLQIMDNTGMARLPDREILNDNDSIRYYIAGCFLAAGSVNPPTTRYYHLEINLHDEKHAEYVSKLIKRFNLNPKILKRRNNDVIYIKKSEEISDFLRVINAFSSLMKFEDERISRDFYNSNNRISICEISNEIKVIEAGNKQFEVIKKLIDNNKLHLLSSKDQVIAMLRYENPESSLADLAYLYEVKTGQTISKSGINHSLRRVMELKDKVN